jgi:hypothetical protein
VRKGCVGIEGGGEDAEERRGVQSATAISNNQECAQTFVVVRCLERSICCCWQALQCWLLCGSYCGIGTRSWRVRAAVGHGVNAHKVAVRDVVSRVRDCLCS